MTTGVAHRIGMLGVLLVCVVRAAGAQGLPPTDIPAVDTFIDAPRALFGRTRAGVESALGAPSAIRARTLPGGRRSPTEPVDELDYPGVVIGVSRGSAGLRRVEITEARWTLPGGLNVGVPRSLIEQRLGEPQATTDVSALYLYSDAYPDTVEFYFRAGRVHRIEWLYAPGD
jgi:hypothetical protein